MVTNLLVTFNLLQKWHLRKLAYWPVHDLLLRVETAEELWRQHFHGLQNIGHAPMRFRLQEFSA